MSESYWNEEDENFIKCPYCGAEYEPSYDETVIGDKVANCYTEDTEEYTCSDCGKKFMLTPYQSRWMYKTETIDGEMTEEEWEEKFG